MAGTGTFSGRTLTVQIAPVLTLQPVWPLLAAVFFLNAGPISKAVVPVSYLDKHMVEAGAG